MPYLPPYQKSAGEQGVSSFKCAFTELQSAPTFIDQTKTRDLLSGSRMCKV